MKDYDLVIVGAGSGNMLPDQETMNLRIAIVEADRFGGTCLNRGCIPSKMFVLTADIAEHIRRAGGFGIDASLTHVDWTSIRDRVFRRIDPIHEHAVDYRRRSGVDVYLGQARFIGPRTLEVDDTVIRGDRIVLAVGSRPAIPDIQGLSDVPHHTSDTIMRIDELPASMIVLGGGFIGAEMSHVFGAFGTHITLVHRGDLLLNGQDDDVRRRFTDQYSKRFDLRLGTHIERFERQGTRAVAHLRAADGSTSLVEVDTVLVATGRVPNSDRLLPATAGIALDAHGHIQTDTTYATSAPGVWALGDTANHFQLKHMANAETRLVRHNVLHPEAPEHARFDIVPSAVFADPQVASVGATEQDLRRTGRDYLVGTRDYADTAYGWALEDTTGFAKVLADPHTRLVLGAHILGPQASTLVQPLIQAMCLGTTIDQLAHDVLYIHPALTEVIENALLQIT